MSSIKSTKFSYLIIFSTLLPLFKPLSECLEQSCEATNKDQDCNSDQPSDPSYKYRNIDEARDWSKYLTKIEEALTNYQPCQNVSCSCYLEVIQNDLASWSESGITEDDIKAAKDRGTLYQIVDHKLYRDGECMFPFRCAGVEYFILKIIDKLPNMEFVLNTRDWPQCSKFNNLLPVLSFSKTPNFYDITYPAWTFWQGGPAISLYPTGLGRWDLQRDIIPKEAGKWPWDKKLLKAFFRGSRTSAERDPLILLSRREPDLVDAQYTKNQAWKSDKDTLGAAPVEEVSLQDHCKYKYLFNFRGVAASFRFKHLFLCHSLVFNVESEWTEFFYFAMKPWVHYIPVKNDLSDVKELLEFATENDLVVQEIAERGFSFIWNHLRMEDIACYWKRLLRRYSKLLKYEVSLNESLQEIKLK